LPGEYRPDLDAVFGLSTVEAVGFWRADVAALSVPAVAGGRMFHPLAESVALKRAMTQAATRRLLLVDHTKFGHTAAHVFGSVRDSDVVIVDSAAPDEEVAALRDIGAEVRVVPGTRTPPAGS
jgi:DeoR/GlpR family transcriptional regulator of sugar metabolism